MKKIKVGILGYGFMGKTHYKMLKNDFSDKYKVIAICENDKKQLDENLDEDVKIYTEIKDILKDPEIETVIISLPNDLHKEVIVSAAENKKDILCEKPVTLSLEELEVALKSVKLNDVRFTVHQQRRFDIDYRTAKNVFESNELGKVYTIQSKLYGFNGNMHDWHVYPEKGGGMLLDWGVHLIDQILWMSDSPLVSVYADMKNVINEKVDDYFKILLKFEDGKSAEIELGTYFLSDKDKWFERHWFIGGDKGSYSSDGFEPKNRLVKTTRLLENVPGKITMTEAGPTRSFGPPSDDILIVKKINIANTDHKMYFENYYDSIVNNKEFLVKTDEIVELMKVIEAVKESSNNNKVIKMG